jgi:hypothetical protein
VWQGCLHQSQQFFMQKGYVCTNHGKSFMKRRDHMCTNHRSPSCKCRTVFAPVTFLLLGHQGRCSHSGLGVNGCRVVQSSQKLMMAESSVSCLKPLWLGLSGYLGARVVHLQQAAVVAVWFPQGMFSWSVQSSWCWHEDSPAGCLADGPSLKELGHQQRP